MQIPTFSNVVKRLQRTFDKERDRRELESSWQTGIVDEIAFWDDYVATEGGLWPEDFQVRMDPAQQLQQHIIDVFAQDVAREINMLDVGAGPLTYVGKVWPEHILKITAIDPLAEEYATIFQKHNLTPPVRTRVGFAERLVEQFGENQFDFVHARNCIDHSYDPALAIEQMVAVTKPGGIVYMHHAMNEATMQSYQGFHQWNLYGTVHCLYVGNRERTINMTRRLAFVADLSNQLFGNNEWIVTTIHKRNPTSPLKTLLQVMRSYQQSFSIPSVIKQKS